MKNFDFLSTYDYLKYENLHFLAKVPCVFLLFIFYIDIAYQIQADIHVE